MTTATKATPSGFILNQDVLRIIKNIKLSWVSVSEWVSEFVEYWGAYAPKNFLMSNVVFRTSSFSLSVIFVIFFLLVLRAFILVANFLSGGVCDDDFSQVDINLVLVVFFCWVESSLPLVPWFKSRISRQIHKRTLKGVKRHVKILNIVPTSQLSKVK